MNYPVLPPMKFNYKNYGTEREPYIVKEPVFIQDLLDLHHFRDEYYGSLNKTQIKDGKLWIYKNGEWVHEPITDNADFCGKLFEKRWEQPEKETAPSGTACKTPIFSERVLDIRNLSENIGSGRDYKVFIYKDMITISLHAQAYYRSNRELKEDVHGFEDNSIKIRGDIEAFSGKARYRMIKRLAMWEDIPNLFFELTYPDEFFTDDDLEKGFNEKASKVLKRFKERLDYNMPEISGYWKKELVDRKSGLHKGKMLPHYHNLINSPEIESIFAEAKDKKELKKLVKEYALKILGHWIEALHLEGVPKEKAKKVTLHRKSYRSLQGDVTLAKKYISKYITKEQKVKVNGSAGRFWGKIGKPRTGEDNMGIIINDQQQEFKELIKSINLALDIRNEKLKKSKYYEKKIKQNPAYVSFYDKLKNTISDTFLGFSLIGINKDKLIKTLQNIGEKTGNVLLKYLRYENLALGIPF